MKVKYELMTPGEVVEARNAVPLAFVPVGPLEWHGPHLPLGTDGLHAHHLALRVAQEVGGVVLPACFAGTETLRSPGRGVEGLWALGFSDDERIVGMDFPGNSVKSLYFEESAFGITVREIVRCLKRDDFRLIVIVNGHGAPNHKETLRRIAAEESEPPTVDVLFHSAWVSPVPPQADPGHAEKHETSILMALEGEHVRIDRLPARDDPIRYPEFGIVDGAAFDGNPNVDFVVPKDADPRYSSREEGEAILAAEVKLAVEVVRRALAARGSS